MIMMNMLSGFFLLLLLSIGRFVLGHRLKVNSGLCYEYFWQLNRIQVDCILHYII